MCELYCIWAQNDTRDQWSWLFIGVADCMLQMFGLIRTFGIQSLFSQPIFGNWPFPFWKKIYLNPCVNKHNLTRTLLVHPLIKMRKILFCIELRGVLLCQKECITEIFIYLFKRGRNLSNLLDIFWVKSGPPPPLLKIRINYNCAYLLFNSIASSLDSWWKNKG